jgi:hypothetical protein
MGDVGSVAIGGWIARVVLVVLVVQAAIEQKYRTAVIGIVLGLAVWLGIGWINAALVTPFLAMLDIGLVFAVLGRDLRLN